MTETTDMTTESRGAFHYLFPGGERPAWHRPRCPEFYRAYNINAACRHDAWEQRRCDLAEGHGGQHRGIYRLAHLRVSTAGQDGYRVIGPSGVRVLVDHASGAPDANVVLRNRAEVEAVISFLRQAADDAWPDDRP